MNCSPPGSSVHGILHTNILEWVAIPFSRGSSQPRDWTLVSCTAGKGFITESLGKAPSKHRPKVLSFAFSQDTRGKVLSNRSIATPYAAAAAKSLQSCPTLCDPMDGSPPGSPVPGILQATPLYVFSKEGPSWNQTPRNSPVNCYWLSPQQPRGS